jgi:hypothetical protein
MARNQAVVGQEAIDFEARLVHEWQVTGLTGLCDSDLDTTAAQAPSRRSETSGPVRHPYEA